MRILALDMATSCGWAHSSGISGTWNLSVRKDESSGMRLIRFKAKLNEIRDSIGIDLVPYEAVRGGAPTRHAALVVLHELQGVLKLWCEENKVQFCGYSQTEIKKHATGKGGSNKEKMVAAAKAKWPNIDIVDDNQADALWILDFAQTLIHIRRSTPTQKENP